MATKTILQTTQLERGDWRVFVNPRPGEWDVEVWLICKQGGKTYNATVEGNRIALTELQEGTTGNAPFFKVPEMVWQLLIDAMSEQTPPIKKERVEAELEAELEAVKRHLEDMRRIVFDSPHHDHDEPEEPEDETFRKN